MSSENIALLMEYCERDLAYAKSMMEKGDHAKSIGESYYAVFYAAKAVLIHLGISSKSHQSVQAGLDSIVEKGLLVPDLGSIPERLLDMRNEAVYRFARRDWTVDNAAECLTQAREFVQAVESILCPR